ncbi:MAG: nuclear transport factor 2 family protein, partial [Gammaproteobacteria bacterium]|nr:nuclear transport factor 2 family protein [Gammaproteobacteria bacterium]
FYRTIMGLSKQRSGRTMTVHGFASAQEAETAFYEAFENADLEAMMQVWSQDDDIECIHPLGDRLVGIAAVSESWRQILSRGKRIQFQLRRSNRFQNEQLAIHSLYENISIGGKSQPPVVAVNIYRFNGSGWHMILHHASPATSIKDESGKHAAGTDRTIH